MNKATLVFVSAEIKDKNGVALKYGRTEEYIEDGVFHKGVLVTCYNTKLWKQFVAGLEIAL